MQFLLTISYMSLLIIPLLRKLSIINDGLYAFLVAFSYLIMIIKCINLIQNKSLFYEKSILLICKINIFLFVTTLIFSLIFSPANLQNILLDSFGAFFPISISLVFAFCKQEIIKKNKFLRPVLLTTILIFIAHLLITILESYQIISFGTIHGIHGIDSSLKRSGGIFDWPIPIFPVFLFFIFREIQNKFIKLVTFLLFISIIFFTSISTSILFLYFLIFPILIILWTDSKLSKRKLKKRSTILITIFLSLAIIFQLIKPVRDFSSSILDVSTNRIVIKVFYRTITRPAMQLGIVDPLSQEFGFSENIKLWPKFGYGILLSNSNTYIDNITSYKISGEFVIQRILLQWGYIFGFILIVFTRIIPAFLFYILIIDKKIELNPTKKIIFSLFIITIIMGAIDFRYIDYISCFGALTILLKSNLTINNYIKK